MKVFIKELIEVERVSIKIEDGGMVADKTLEQIKEGFLTDVSEITNFDENNKNIRFSDNSTLIKIPNNKIIISGDSVKNSNQKRRSGCGGCAKKRKAAEERKGRRNNVKS